MWGLTRNRRSPLLSLVFFWHIYAPLRDDIPLRTDVGLSCLAVESSPVATGAAYGVNLVSLETPNEQSSATATSDSLSLTIRPRRRFNPSRHGPRADVRAVEELLQDRSPRRAGQTLSIAKEGKGATAKTRKVTFRPNNFPNLYRSPDGSVVCGEGGTYGQVTAGGVGGSAVSWGPTGHVVHVQGAPLTTIGGKATLPLVNSQDTSVNPGASLVVLCTGVGEKAVAMPASKVKKTTVGVRIEHGSPKYVGARGRLYVKRMDNIANTSRVLSRIAAVVGYSLLAVWLTQHARLTRAIFNMQKHGQVQPLTAALAEIGFLPKTDSDIQLFFLIVSLADEKKVRLLQHWLGRKDPRVQLYGRLHAAAARINKLHLISVFALSSMAALKSFSRDRRRAAQAERNWLSRRRQRATGGRSTEEEEEAAGEGGSPAPDDDEQIEVDLPVDSN